MSDTEDSGWDDIHNCAALGYIKSIEKFVETDKDLLEMETSDDLRQTPFLIAVSNGHQGAITCLINLGAKVNAVNAQQHGAVEISALKEHVFLLQYFIALDLPSLPVWGRLLKMLKSDDEESVHAFGKCLKALTDSHQGISPDWQAFHRNGGVAAVIHVARNSLQDYAKIPALETCLNVMERPEIQEQLVSSGGVPAFIQLLKSTDNRVVLLSAQIIRELSKVPDFSEALSQNQAIPQLLKVIQTIHDPDVIIPIVQSLGNMAQASPKLQAAVGSVHSLVASLVSLFDGHNHQDLILAITNTVSKMAEWNTANQNAFVSEGITQRVVNIMMVNVRNKAIQASAVGAIHRLAENNKQAQDDLIDRGADRLLMQMLKRNRAEALQEKIAMALWVLAGDNNNSKLDMANDIGIQMLIEFVNSKLENLHFIGSDGLGVLAQGPLSQQEDIGRANGIQPLVQLMKSKNENNVLSVIRTLRHLCVGVGCVPHRQNQATVFHSQGIRLLVALLVHSTNEVMQVEAAYTLGSVSLGSCKEIQDEIFHKSDFNYARILKMLYSREPFVRLTAGSALACYAYNNLHQQRLIAMQGGVRFQSFLPFLQSEDDLYRCSAAYQVVILSRIIPDVAQASSSAAGIKLLVDLLKDSKSEELLALVADYIARLSHTRAGLPAAILAVNTVDYLCTLLLSSSDQVRGNAAIALGYLSLNHKGERLILHRCRNDPYLMKVIKYYTKRLRLATTFTEGWQHYRKVGLPPIPEGRPSLVHRSSRKDGIQPVTIINLEENGSCVPSSNSALNEDGDITCRCSRGSSRRGSTHSSLVSLGSQRSLVPRTSLVYSGDAV